MVYEGKKVYGPYTRKDRRQIVILKTPGNTEDRVTVSYPKYLVECALDRYLDSFETIDHIDGNFLNNDLKNLRIVNKSEHCRSHVLIRIGVSHTCPVCGKSYVIKYDIRKTCGSKHCAGYYTHLPESVKLQHEKDIQVRQYISTRNTLSVYADVAKLADARVLNTLE